MADTFLCSRKKCFASYTSLDEYSRLSGVAGVTGASWLKRTGDPGDEVSPRFLAERGEGEGEGETTGRKREGGVGTGYSSNLIPFSCGAGRRDTEIKHINGQTATYPIVSFML